MRVALLEPYADARAADLVLALDAPTADPLEALTVRIAGFAVQLGVLGHSHQVLLEGADLRLSETVACRPGVPGDLPGTRVDDRDGHRYAFAAAVDELEPARCAELAHRVAADPHGIVAVFAQEEAAFTALRARPAGGGVRWETWHAYPQSGELVSTTGTVLPR